MTSLRFISAGAGSGKTHALTGILSDALTSGQAQPAGVIATTFTNKAAAELRERVRQRLLDEGHFSLASAMGQASIGTVNSVCGELLQRFTFEAGLAPQTQVIDEPQAAALLAESIDALRDATQLAEIMTLVQRLGITDWLADLKTLVGLTRANDIAPALLRQFADDNARDLLAHFPKPLATDPTAALVAAIEVALRQIEPTAAASGIKKSRDYLENLRSCKKGLRDGNLPWSEWIGLIAAEPEKACLPDAEPVQDIARQYAAHPALHADIRDWLTLMFGLAADVIEDFQRRKRALGVLDFTDQEHLALQLLDQPAVTAVLADELDLLLVDEFQDTSPMQLALFMKLAGLARQTSWVGDIKQAIYGFRGSDTALMQSMQTQLPNLGGSKSRLEFSWRSTPELVQLVNAVFTTAFSDLPAEEVTLTPQRAAQLDQPAFANWMLEGKNQSLRSEALASGVARLLQSRRLVIDKVTGQARGLQAGDIAILSRSNDGVARIAEVLAQAGIAVATARPGLLATPEAVLALACLRRLHDCGDTVASAEILSLSDGEPAEDWLSDRLRYLHAGGNCQDWRVKGSRPHPLLQWLNGMRDQLPLLTPAEALQQVVTASGLPRIVLQWQASADTARQRLANLQALLELAAQYEDQCRNRREAASVAGLLLWLQQMQKQEQDQQALPALDAVRVLTHHAAKGLEWPVVILTDLEKPAVSRLWGISACSTEEFDAREPLRQRRIRYWPWPFSKRSSNIDIDETLRKSDLGRHYQDVADEEAKRLLYVSMTRARDMLVLAHNAGAASSDWLALLEAGWLKNTDCNTQQLQISEQEAVHCEHWLLEGSPVAALAEPPQPPLYGLQMTLPETRLPLIFNPSSAAAGHVGIIESCAIGKRLQVAGDVDWATLGSALHACIAADLSDPRLPLSEQEIGAILNRFGIASALQPAAVMQQLQAFRNWLAQRWPGYRVMAEVPLHAPLANGQHLYGRIDLLLETADGYILFDHKSSPQGSGQWQGLAEQHAGQLAAYAAAVEQATARSVTERWLYLPVAGNALQV